MSLRILIVRVGAMGDVLHGLPAIAALREALPGCRIGWAIEPRWHALLSAGRERGPRMPMVDRLHEVRTQVWKQSPLSIATIKDIAKLRRELRAERYDVCVDLQGSIRSAFIGRMAGAARFVGSLHPREALARLLYGERIASKQVNVIGPGLRAGSRRDRAGDRALCRDLAHGYRGRGLGRLRAAPNNLTHRAADSFRRLGRKEWGATNYRELAARLRAAGMKVLVNAAAAEDSTARAVTANGAATTVVASLEH